MSDTAPAPRSLLLDGLWRDNPALVKLLGLCPLLAVSNTLANATGLGIATLITLLVANGSVASLRRLIPRAIRIPLYVLIIGSTVGIIDMLMAAWFTELHRSLGIFLPLIVTNCLIMGRAEAFAVRQGVVVSLIDALAMGCGFLLVLLVLGGIRQWLGQSGLLLAVLPPGAFMTLGLLLALRNSLLPTNRS